MPQKEEHVPTYQYACTECRERTEVVQRFSDEPLTVCTACGGRVRKVFSPVGIVFKGSGFYRTDSRAAVGANGKGVNGSAPEKPESGAGGDSGSAGTDKKAAGIDKKKKTGEPAGAAPAAAASASASGSGTSSSSPSSSGSKVA